MVNFTHRILIKDPEFVFLIPEGQRSDCTFPKVSTVRVRALFFFRPIRFLVVVTNLDIPLTLVSLLTKRVLPLCPPMSLSVHLPSLWVPVQDVYFGHSHPCEFDISHLLTSELHLVQLSFFRLLSPIRAVLRVWKNLKWRSSKHKSFFLGEYKGSASLFLFHWKNFIQGFRSIKWSQID